MPHSKGKIMSRNRYVRWVIGAIVITGMGPTRAADLSGQPGITQTQFIYDEAPFPSCHASTIVETKSGLVTAWFGGTNERHPDVGIWVARNEGRGWSPPVEVATGVQHSQKRYPCWNPVLFQPRDGPLLLFYKVGPSPQAWWGMVMTSPDGGRSWSEPRRLPDMKGKIQEVRAGKSIVSGSGRALVYRNLPAPYRRLTGHPNLVPIS